MTSGPALFARFAYPPNSLGYCGPGDTTLLGELITGGEAARDELRQAALAFAGAWPYLELIGRSAGVDPLDAAVVEAYWIGNDLLDQVETQAWGNSSDDRFRARAGFDWARIADALNAGGVPNHAFHVFCAYPWVGLLRSGSVDESLNVLDRCRIRWGRVVGKINGSVLATSRPLQWDGERLAFGAERVEEVQASVDPSNADVEIGDTVAMHWDYICQRLTGSQLRRLRRFHDLHLAIVNDDTKSLAVRLDV